MNEMTRKPTASNSLLWMLLLLHMLHVAAGTRRVKRRWCSVRARKKKCGKTIHVAALSILTRNFSSQKCPANGSPKGKSNKGGGKMGEKSVLGGKAWKREMLKKAV